MKHSLLSTFLLVLSAYATPEPLLTRADSIFVQARLPIGKIKAETVILQAGTGNTARVANSQKAGQRGGRCRRPWRLGRCHHQKSGGTVVGIRARGRG